MSRTRRRSPRADLDLRSLNLTPGGLLFEEVPVMATAAELNLLSGVTATGAELSRAADVSARLVNLTAATLALTEALHDGKIVTVNRAAGATLTLPAATGSGAWFRVVIGTTLTSGSLILNVVGNDLMKGIIFVLGDDAGAVLAFANGADSDTITLNRTTTGVGTAGEWFEFVDIAADTWHVRGFITASGTEASPFSAAVS